MSIFVVKKTEFSWENELSFALLFKIVRQQSPSLNSDTTRIKKNRENRGTNWILPESGKKITFQRTEITELLHPSKRTEPGSCSPSCRLWKFPTCWWQWWHPQRYWPSPWLWGNTFFWGFAVEMWCRKRWKMTVNGSFKREIKHKN